MKDFIKKRPSAFIPILMSIGALTLPWIWFFIFGPNPTGDEGGAAHIFQLLMGLQVPIIIYFLLRWFPKKPKETIQILFLQFIAGVLAFLPVFLLEH